MLLIFQFSLTELRDSVLIYPNVLSANIAPQKTHCGFLITLGTYSICELCCSLSDLC